MAAGPGDGERLSPGEDAGGGRGRFLVAVLVLQLVLATIFVVLVATDSLPIPGLKSNHPAATTAPAPAGGEPSP